MPRQKQEPIVTEPPAHLSERSKELWRANVPSRCHSAGRLALLQAGLEALDLSDRARTEVHAGELTTTTKTTGAQHLHPCIKTELEARRQFASIWDKLALHWDQDIDGRIWP